MTDRQKLAQFENQLAAYSPILETLKSKDLAAIVKEFGAGVDLYRKQLTDFEAIEDELTDLPNQAAELHEAGVSLQELGAKLVDLKASWEIAAAMLPSTEKRLEDLGVKMGGCAESEVRSEITRIAGAAEQQIKKDLPGVSKQIAQLNLIVSENERRAAEILQVYAKTGAPAVQTTNGAATLEETQNLVSSLIRDLVAVWGKGFDYSKMTQQEARIFQATSRGLATGKRTPEEAGLIYAFTKLWIDLFYKPNGS